MSVPPRVGAFAIVPSNDLPAAIPFWERLGFARTGGDSNYINGFAGLYHGPGILRTIRETSQNLIGNGLLDVIAFENVGNPCIVNSLTKRGFALVRGSWVKVRAIETAGG